MPGISPKLPLSIAPSDGYSLNQTMPQVVQQNLKNLFLTNPGERMMDPAFGIGLKKFLFEPNLKATHNNIKVIATKQIKKYMPFITIQAIDITQDTDDGNALYISVKYLISPLNQTDLLNLEVRS